MNIDKERIDKEFEEFFDNDCDEIYDAKEEIISFVERIVKLYNLHDVIKRKWWDKFYIGYAITLTVVNLIAGILAFMFL